MPACDYCEASFEGETAYLAHLRDEHEGELGAIDQRRVAEFEAEQERDLPVLWLGLGGVALLLLGLLVYSTMAVDVGEEDLETAPLPEEGNQTLLEDVETYPSEGNEHVPQGTDVDYDVMPPVSGPHDDAAADAGFYEETPPLGEIVHTLEHGGVVIYYDPVALPPDAERSLRQFADIHTGTWRSVVVAPTPVEEPESAYVLTAWRHVLRIDEYDAATVRAFLAEYLGRGPENPVR